MWATTLSRRVPENDASTRLANVPNAAYDAICGSPTTLNVMASKAGRMTAASMARIAAGADHLPKSQPSLGVGGVAAIARVTGGVRVTSTLLRLVTHWCNVH